MKKIILVVIAICVVLTALAFNSNNKVNKFFTQNNGTIYNQDGFLWTTQTMDKGFFSSNYETQFGVAGTMFNLTHSSSFNPFGANVKSVVTLPDSFMANESKETLAGTSLDSIIPDLSQIFSKYLIVHAKNGLHSFFTKNGGSIYNKSGIIWKLESQNVGDFNATYETRLSSSLFEEDILGKIKTKHVATLNEVNATLFNIGNMVTTITMPEIEDLPKLSNKEFTFNSTITFGGFDSKINVLGRTASIDDEYDYYGYKKSLAYEDINISFITSFDSNMLDIDINIPLVVGLDIDENNQSTQVFEFKNITFKQLNIFNQEVGFWIGGGVANIGKMVAFNRFSEVGTPEFYLENLTLESNTKLSNNSSTAGIDFKIFVKELMFQDVGETFTFKNFDFDFVLDNLNSKSVKKFYDTFESLQYPYSEYQAMLQFTSLAAEIPAILEKKPRFVLNNLSGEYDNETHSAKGFIEYNGVAKTSGIFTTDDLKNFYGKFDVKIGEHFFKNALKKDASSTARWEVYDDDVVDPEFESNFKEIDATKVEKESKEVSLYQQKLNARTDVLYNEKIKRFENLGSKIVDGYINFVYEIKDGLPLVNGRDISEFK